MSPELRGHPRQTDRGGPALWGCHDSIVACAHSQWFDAVPCRELAHGHGESDLLAATGITKIRLPIRLEHASSLAAARTDAGHDARLGAMRRAGIQPILTFSGVNGNPSNVAEPASHVAVEIACRAAETAERYPWIDDFTPIATLSSDAQRIGLGDASSSPTRSEQSCWRRLLDTVDVTRLVIRAIRRINPAARLIQPDDAGFRHSSCFELPAGEPTEPGRWLFWDILCGRVDPHHPGWSRAAAFGLSDRLRSLADDPCPPDVLVIDGHQPGGRPLGSAGLIERIERTWHRYRLPIAATVCASGDAREAQAREIVATWDAATALRSRGVDLQALVIPSLLGRLSWNRMVTTSEGHYEPGLYDARSHPPRATMLTRVLSALAAGRRPHEPGLERGNPLRMALRPGSRPSAQARPLAILAGNELIVRLAIEACEARGLSYLLVDHHRIGALRAARPWALLDASISLQRCEPPPAATVDLCLELGITGAFIRGFAPDHEAEEPPCSLPAHMLTVDTDPVFTAADDAATETRILDALDAGRPIMLDGSTGWSGVYGPSLVNSVIDLLLDGATGQANFVAERGWSVADVGRALAQIAGSAAGLIGEERASGLPSRGGYPVASYLPPLEHSLARFVADRRRIRMQDGVIVWEAAE